MDVAVEPQMKVSFKDERVQYGEHLCESNMYRVWWLRRCRLKTHCISIVSSSCHFIQYLVGRFLQL